jgi:eukaryotic-like serine/threonine-protein kinase
MNSSLGQGSHDDAAGPITRNVEQLLESVVEHYLERLQAGHSPDQPELLTLSPEIAELLEQRLQTRRATTEVEQLLESVAESYLDRLQAGQAPARQELVSRYPEIAELLERRLRLVELMHYLTREQTSSGKESPDVRDADRGKEPSSLPAVTTVGSALHTVPYLGSNIPGPAAPELADFEVLRPLGAGAFGQVFLARQRSLGRLVAVKLSPNQGSEARTLASLEHDHIVRVFSETVDPVHDLRILCMQYVPGSNLAGVIQALVRRPMHEWSGRALVEAIDANSGGQPNSTALESSDLRDRDFLAGCDFIEAVCWLGARLAEALSRAHRQGILHRDIKPANILLHRNGRPLLADFNLAGDRHRGGLPGGELFGGTLIYMAPEHLDAFNPEANTSREAVDQRSDIYSLGLVLFELLTGQRPSSLALRHGQDSSPALLTGATLRALAAERRREAPSPRRLSPEVPEVLDRVVRRCLEPDPARRFQSAAELAAALEGCGELTRWHKALPSGGSLTRTALAYPLAVGLLLPLLPHLVGALVAFGYTAAWVASHPARPALETLFGKLALGYCLVVFPLTGGLTVYLARPIWQMCVRLRGPTLVGPVQVTEMRRRALRKPALGVMLSSLGWLPGAVVLPLLMVHLVPEAAGWDVLLHYFLSFLIAGLIALTYTEFVDQFLLLRVAYPFLWAFPHQARQTARAELDPVDRRLRVFQVLSGLIPVASGFALLIGLVSASPEQRASSGYQGFLVLVLVLMALGMAGAWFAVVISDRLRRVLAALKG